MGTNIYRNATRRGEYRPLATDTEVNSCFSISSEAMTFAVMRVIFAIA